MEQNTKEPNREAELLIACHEEVVANLKAELAALRRDKAELEKALAALEEDNRGSGPDFIPGVTHERDSNGNWQPMKGGAS